VTYARQPHNLEAERQACEIRLRAERRAAQLLKQTAKSGERDRGSGGNRKSQSRDATVKLSDSVSAKISPRAGRSSLTCVVSG